MFSNEHATLSLHKTSMRGKVHDYKIIFHDSQQDLRHIIAISSDIVKQLIDKFHADDISITGRLIARVNYFRITTDEEVTYYHASYRSEVIDDAIVFYQAHMMKILERMEMFNENGSNLLIKSIEEIHLHITPIN